MGNYTQLFLGKYYYSWKNSIPAYLALIFEESDFFAIWDDTDNCYSSIGYKTTCDKAVKKLEKFGYSMLVVSEIYGYFYQELLAVYEGEERRYISKVVIDDNTAEDAVRNRYLNRVSSPHESSRFEEVFDFINFIKTILSDGYKNPWSEESVMELSDGRNLKLPSREYGIKSVFDSGEIRIDFEALHSFLCEDFINNPPWIFMLVSLFSTDNYFLYEYPEIVTIMFLRLILETIDDGTAEIKLELGDIVEDEEEVRSLIPGLGKQLIDKISFYNKIFHTLFLNEEDIKTNYIKAQCKEYLTLCKKTSSNFEKGKALENLTEMLFTSNNSLDLIDKRVSTGDEEIDLLIKNNVDRPFWMAFSSPLFFVECKNWNKAVGASEIRNFEIKLQNHGNVVKVGFFVSLNGFTSGAINELKRLGRDKYHIVAIEYKDIFEFVNSSEQFFNWLENKASKIY